MTQKIDNIESDTIGGAGYEVQPLDDLQDYRKKYPSTIKPTGGFWSLSVAVAWIASREDWFTASVECEEMDIIGIREGGAFLSFYLAKFIRKSVQEYFCRCGGNSDCDCAFAYDVHTGIDAAETLLQNAIANSDIVVIGNDGADLGPAVAIHPCWGCRTESDGLSFIKDETHAKINSNAVRQLWPADPSAPLPTKAVDAAKDPRTHTGLAGGPTSKHLVEAIMKERMENLETLGTLAGEVAECLKLFSSDPRCTGLNVPKQDATQNSLRSSYNAWKTANAEKP